MLAKGHSRADVLVVLTALAESGLLSDLRFTECYLRFRRGKGIGPKRIALELQAKGVSAQMIAEHLEMADNAWFTEARKVWLKQFKGKLPTDFKSRAKQMRFLQYRGFTREHIASVLEIEDSDHHDHEEESIKQQ